MLVDSCLLVGDFNYVLWSWEKEGGNTFNSNQALNFQNFISICSLMDLGFSGDIFTWNNRRSGAHNIREGLDHQLASYSWVTLYPNAQVFHLDDLGSDPHPLLLNLDTSTPKAKRFFRFDARWISESEANSIISDAWNCESSGSTLFRVFSKLKACRHTLVALYKRRNTILSFI
ncbi:hypothetical protein MANES_04G067501v8 [Manihot esculenta]|uniref:Uncharacterized protein n=1 Tax=Manihot esculenta TaxID=3983 RepID=A0ACB7HSK4_MANES|nr:hypothetical protein MANES_04G067501v8 [Manihot esculenta]